MKNFDKYWDKLLKFSKVMKIKVVLSATKDDGNWSPSRRKITIDTDIEESNKIATMLHELGHVFDDMRPTTSKETELSDKAYGKIYICRATKKQKKIVQACEERAWNMGVTIAKLLHIPLGKWYKRERLEARKYYRDNY